MSAVGLPVSPPSRALLMLEGRAMHEFAAFMLFRPWLSAAPRGDGHPVLVFPGLLADDLTTQPLRGFLKEQGWAVHGWKQGRNLGLRTGVEEQLIGRFLELHQRHDGRRLSLVGWSLGGLYARQLAKLFPDKVRCVVTLGSPFAGTPEAADDRRAPLAEPPPVPTTSIFSRTDGICAWQTCLNLESSLTENIEVHGSHCGLPHHPAAVYAVADRLAQPEAGWRKFERSGWRAFVYPDSGR
ncbi:MAG: alpha/beta fold hydrolase [Reyranellaceae bacterium]